MFEEKYLMNRIKVLNLGGSVSADAIVNDITKTEIFLKQIFQNKASYQLSSYNLFIDLIFFHLLKSFIRQKAQKSLIYKKIQKINSSFIDVDSLFWSQCFWQLDNNEKMKIIGNKDYDFFWYPYAMWIEEILHPNHDNMDKIIQTYMNKKIRDNHSLDNKTWMTVKEVAQYTNLSIGTIYNYTSKGKIPHTNEAGLKFNKSQIDEWLISKGFDPDKL